MSISGLYCVSHSDLNLYFNDENRKNSDSLISKLLIGILLTRPWVQYI
jgi:hypothetical protein